MGVLCIAQAKGGPTTNSPPREYVRSRARSREIVAPRNNELLDFLDQDMPAAGHVLHSGRRRGVPSCRPCFSMTTHRNVWV